MRVYFVQAAETPMNFLRQLAVSVVLLIAASVSRAQVYYQHPGIRIPTPSFGDSFSTPAPDNTTLTLRVWITGAITDVSQTLKVQVSVYSLADFNSGSMAEGWTGRQGILRLSLVTSGAADFYYLRGTNTMANTGFGMEGLCIYGPGGLAGCPVMQQWASDTMTSLRALAASLKTPLTLAKATAENALSYDCDRFDASNLCFTAIGRRLSGQGADYSENAGAIMLMYKPSPAWRIGGYVDQGSSSRTANLRVGSDMPLVGANAIWNEAQDGQGLEVRAGIAFRQQTLGIARAIVGTSEPGAGSTQMTSKLAAVAAYYNHQMSDGLSLAPYAGLRYYQGQVNGYAEAASDMVTTPLTYARLAENTLSGSIGVRATGSLGKTSIAASVGLERDLSSELDALSATGELGLSPVSINGYKPHANRVVAALGVSRDLGERQRASLSALYRQEAFRSMATTALFMQYQIGF